MRIINKIINHYWRILVFFCVNHLLDGTNPRYFGIKRSLLRSIGFEIGERTRIVGPISCFGKLSIGNDCWIGANFTVRGNGQVRLGDRIDVGPDVTFLTGTHRIGDTKRRAGEGYNCHIQIGDACWIGGKSVFVNEIILGNSSIVAASACVCRSFNSNVLLGGVPAKVIKSLDS